MKFVRTKSRTWRGNGFGYDGAEYNIVANGEVVGTVYQTAVGDWRARIGDDTIKTFDGKQKSLRLELEQRLK